MGICLSCCGWRHADDDYSESQRLLFDDPYQSHYGGIGSGSFPQGIAPQPDPEELKRERDALERLCAQTTDKLIDVSQPPASHVSKVPTDYPRLFAEAFPHRSRHSAHSSFSSNDQYHADLQLQQEASAATAVGGGSGDEADERSWLQRIMQRDLAERRWDWRVVRKIEGELTFDFGEFAGEGEGEMAEAKKKGKG